MAKVIVDTGAIYALLDRSDVNHEEAVRLLHKIRESGDTPFLTNFVVAETHALLLARFNTSVARSWLQGLIWPVEAVTHQDEDRAVDIILFHEDKAFSYTDATTFAVAERLAVKNAFAFDKHFTQYGLSLYT